MKSDNSDTVYIVHSKILGLGETPFVSDKFLRDVWRPFFNSKQCFTGTKGHLCRNNCSRHEGKLFISSDKEFADENSNKPIIHEVLYGLELDPGFDKSKKDLLSGKPFLKKLGTIKFNPISMPLLGNGTCFLSSVDIQDILYNGKNVDIQFDKYFGYTRDYPDRFFGYNSKLQDQRMYFLNWSLHKPLFISSQSVPGVRAEGKIFIHIFPSGYIIIKFVIHLNWKSHQENLNNLILETRPWRSKNQWTWNSKLGNGSLNDIYLMCFENLRTSFYTEPERVLVDRQVWSSSIKLFSDDSSEQIVSGLSLHRSEVLEIQTAMSPDSSMRYMITSPQGNVCVYRMDAKRKSALTFFWKALSIFEFVLWKSRIYSDYQKLLDREILNLKGYRLSLKQKATQEDLLRLSVYDHKIPEFLWALDTYIQAAAPFHRRIYSQVSSTSGLDRQRKQTNSSLNEWISEVEQWEHGILKATKTIIPPLKRFLG